MPNDYVVVLLAAVLTTCIVFALLLGVMISQGYKTLGEWAKVGNGPGALWVEGSKLYYVDQAGTTRVLLGSDKL